MTLNLVYLLKLNRLNYGAGQTITIKNRRIDLTGATTLSTFCSKMEQNGNSVKDSVPNLVPKNQTDISTGIGPTGTDTPAPKDLMPHADEQVGFPNCTKRHLVCLKVCKHAWDILHI